MKWGILMRYLTAGESHGKQLTTIIEGVPARMPLLKYDIDESLLRRQKGHGSGRRMQIEKYIVNITGGIRYGSIHRYPISLTYTNDTYIDIYVSLHRRI